LAYTYNAVTNVSGFISGKRYGGENFYPELSASVAALVSLALVPFAIYNLWLVGRGRTTLDQRTIVDAEKEAVFRKFFDRGHNLD